MPQVRQPSGCSTPDANRDVGSTNHSLKASLAAVSREQNASSAGDIHALRASF